MGSRTRVQVATDAWSTTRYILPGSESPGSAGHATGHRARARGAQDRWSNAGPRIRARVPRDRGTPRGPWPQARDTRDCWSTPRSLGPGPGSPGTAGRPLMPSDLGTSHPGQRVNSTVLRHWPESCRTAGRHHGPADPSAIRPGDLVETASPWNRARVARGSWSIPQAIGLWPVSPRTMGQPLGP